MTNQPLTPEAFREAVREVLREELAPIERKLAELPAILDALREVSSINRDWLKSLHQARANRTLKRITQMQDR